MLIVLPYLCMFMYHPATLFLGKNFHNPLNRRVCGIQS